MHRPRSRERRQRFPPRRHPEAGRPEPSGIVSYITILFLVLGGKISTKKRGLTIILLKNGDISLTCSYSPQGLGRRQDFPLLPDVAGLQKGDRVSHAAGQHLKNPIDDPADILELGSRLASLWSEPAASSRGHWPASLLIYFIQNAR